MTHLILSIMFKENDKKQLKMRGISHSEAEQQIGYLKKGFPFMRLAKAASLQHGISKLTSEQLKNYISHYEAAVKLTRVKFVPASGAATRMFKALFEFDELFRQSNYDPKVLSKEAYKHVKECFDRIGDFAFFSELQRAVSKSGSTVENALKSGNYHVVLSSLLSGDGMNYGSLPKGLLTFHRYNHQTRTAVEEHLVEGSGYAADSDGQVNIHLTVSPEHKSSFDTLLKKLLKQYEEQFKVHYNITFSVQKPSTDTLAIDDKQQPFREADGSLHFRPGGHGALLENLNDIDADIIFIKNIDNVTHDRNKTDTLTYKKALGGLLIHFRDRIYGYLKQLDDAKSVKAELLKEIWMFLGDELGTLVPQKILKDQAVAVAYFKGKLNRPLRVCGMVVNTGEPGGGPFWTLEKDGTTSLQIVETSQVDMHEPEQAAILSSATHFNPVDIVCSVRDYKGKKFDLMSFRDPDTGFISKKFKNG
ncbi:MAG: DUF4301 family protein, partial [Bacteroidales bacterium]|nr:DUF4301 family protein [Bacteroidales bacterium]